MTTNYGPGDMARLDADFWRMLEDASIRDYDDARECRNPWCHSAATHTGPCVEDHD